MAVREYFWGTELSESQKTAVWDPEAEDKDMDNNDSSGITHFLFLKQAALGEKAKEGERNLVEVEAEDFDGKTIKLPLFSLKLGLNESTVLDIGAQPPITLRLIKGSGPVCVSGQHALELNEDDMDMFEDDEAEESPVRGQPLQKAKKRPASSTDGPAKKAKLNEGGAKKPGAIGDDDEDSSDDEDFDPNLGDDSDEEEGDDSDEEESDMEEGSPDKKPKKGEEKAQTNGSAQKKPKTQQKADGEPKSLDKIKQELKKSPSKPKKRNKFNNFVKTQYKLTDDKAVEELWTWYKESVIST